MDWPTFLFEVPSQAPAAPPAVDWLTALIDRGPWGIVVILMIALFWLFRYEETKIERMREEHRAEWNEARKDSTQLLVKATEVIAESNKLSERLIESNARRNREGE